MGQFIPAALDILRDHAWIPRTTLPNVHPPGLMTYLAAVWAVTGYSVLVIAARRSRCRRLAFLRSLPWPFICVEDHEVSRHSSQRCC